MKCRTVITEEPTVTMKCRTVITEEPTVTVKCRTVITEDLTVTVKCRIAIKTMFLYFSLCLRVKLDSLSRSFTSISLEILLNEYN